MSTLDAVADWLVALNPFALAALVVAVGWVLVVAAYALWFLYLAAVSGAGETNDGEAETTTHQPDVPFLRSVCAWCEPQATGRDITHGICPAHADEMKREAKL